MPGRRRRTSWKSSPPPGATSRWRLDWKKLIARKDIDLVDVCVPNVMHHDVVIAAAQAGKMVVCEKPLAMNAREAEEMVAAVEKAGVANMVSFNYRRVPAISLAKQIIGEGRIGRPFHYRALIIRTTPFRPTCRRAEWPSGGSIPKWPAPA